jgi:hypothetical protein
MSAPAARPFTIRYFRKMANGERAPFVLTFDEKMTLVSDVPDAEAIQAKIRPVQQISATAQATMRGQQQKAREDYLRSQGIDFDYSADGALIIKNVSDQFARKVQLFNPDIPCWFEGCQQLRDSFFTELADLNIDGCDPDCAKGKLQRKYMELAESYPGFIR